MGHRNAREASVRLAAPNFRKDIQFPPGHQEQGQSIVTNSVKIMNDSWLANSKYVVGDSLTLADLACCMEFGQLCPQFGNIFDFTPYPKVREWMTLMESVPFFSEVNMANTIIGDLNNGVKQDTMVRANKEATAAIQSVLSK